MKRPRQLCAVLLVLTLGLAGCGIVIDYVEIYVDAYAQAEILKEVANSDPMLAILHLTHDEFLDSVANPRDFPTLSEGRIVAGVVPHHNTAAVLISGFFAEATVHADYYDLVIILAPNHKGDLAHVVLSYRDWNIGGGVFTCREFVNDLMAAGDINTVISHSHMEMDHSASILIPYVYYYLPGIQVAPALLNRSLSFNETLELFHWLNNWIKDSGKNILLVASIDFSHFLTVEQSREMDRVTKEAIFSNDLRQIHMMNYHHLDSAAAMIIFLMYLQELGIAPEIAAHTDASEFLGPWLDETTSYMIIAGVMPSAYDTVQVRLTFTGDIMLHQAQMDGAFDFETGQYDFNHGFSEVRPFLQSADLTIGNLETVLAGHFMDDNSGIFPLFSAPDEFGHALRSAGFDLLSTANNHALDQGVDGLLRNLDFLEEIGIGSFGTYRSAQERDVVLVREVQGIRFAFLSYTFGTNGQSIPIGREYLINIINENLIRADIARARELADFVIIMPHMGYEYEPVVRDSIKNWAMMMLEAGADIVVAGHPHVVQSMGFVDIVDSASGEVRRGFVAYCLGNFISSQRKPHTDAGVMLNLYFERAGDAPPTLAAASFIPTWVKLTDSSGNPDIIVLPIAETLRAVNVGENTELRQVDIARMREAYQEISKQILRAANIEMKDEHFLPGNPLTPLK